jgi:tripartite-type tricarboxylate transporter receptor subunit TctC
LTLSRNGTTPIPTFPLKGKESCRQRRRPKNVPSPSGGGLGWGWFESPACVSYVVKAALCGVAALAWATGYAQTYPTRAVRLVVAYAPGGSNDILARALAQKLGETWKQPVLVDNRPGGNTIIGTDLVAKAPPDGHTLLVTPPAFVINPGLVKKLPYDSLRDFTPVSLLNINPQVLVVNPSVPAKSVKELIALARAKPGMLNYSSSGSGGANHLAGELFKSMAGVRIVHVPYKGNAPSLTALVSGEVDFAINTFPSALPFIRSGRLRPLAVTSRARSSVMPELPTIEESGLRGYEAVAWTGLSAPAKTPREIVERINSAVTATIGTAEFRERLKAEGSDPVGSTPEQFAAFLQTEIVKWQKIVTSAGVIAD